jgi:Tfp pilus assembly major pilin PilA
MNHAPALYVVQAGGALNAFAARHAGRDFVVVFSDFLEALGADSSEMKFILGHELGHLKSRHVLKQILLAPGLFLPLLGPAYRRSWESSCDRHGAFAAADVDGAVRAMLTLSGGRQHGRRLNAEAFASQHRDERGFFVSLHELVSTYPTLSRRVTDLLALKGLSPAAAPVRNPFAYFFALFVPGGQTAAPANALILIVIIGLLAAMAIPAFQKVRQSSIAMTCLNNLRQLDAAAEQYALENGKACADLRELTGRGHYIAIPPVCPAGGEYRLVPGTTPEATQAVCTVHGSTADLQRQRQSYPRR